MLMSLDEALATEHMHLATPECVASNTGLAEVVGYLDALPLLVTHGSQDDLIGIVTAFDLL